MSRDPRIDAYIDNAAPFARPILERVREAAHAAIPDVQETMKWSVPHYEHEGIVCGTPAFKAHCAVIFWKPVLDKEAKARLRRMTSIKDLPSKSELVRLMKETARRNERGGVKAPRPKRAAKPPARVPSDLRAALAKNKKAKAAFDAFPQSHRREYIEWITGAKAEATRKRRLDQAIEWIASGKSRNWKYQR